VNQNVKNALLFLVVIVLVVVLWNWITTTRAGLQEIPFSEFLDRVDKNQVSEVLIRSDEILIRSTESPKQKPLGARNYDFVTYSPGYTNLVEELRKHDVKIKAEQAHLAAAHRARRVLVLHVPADAGRR
jgi:cell division protease FtsH